ncbi:MAG: amidohydrolase family protein [Cyclobacteriaceae bacterium]|nr:amidohydrolase family protein [Cyclobacteriaceae bacterium]
MKSFIVILLCSCFVTGFSQSLVDSRKQEIVFKSVNVIPMDTERVLENQDVVVKAGKITAIGATGKVKFGKEAMIIDAKGKYLMPGLAEIHAHVPPVDDIAPMKDVLTLFAVNGVTTIRGMLGHPRHIELRAKIQSGEIIGPHFYTSGPSFNGNSVKTPAEGDKMVRDQKTTGYDFLKIHPGLTLENFNAVTKTAKEVKIPYAGHVPLAVGVWRAMEAGYASIDHMDGFIEGMTPGIETMTPEQIGFFGLFAASKADESKIPVLMKALRENHIWVVPTQCLAERWIAPDKSPDELRNAPEMKYMDLKTLDAWTENKKRQVATPGYSEPVVTNFIRLRKKLIYECQKNGVGLLLGSDAPQVFNVPGFSIHHELKYMVDAGLTPYEALRSGTVNVATFYHQTDRGTIKTGNISDLILLNGNPLKDITQTTKIEGVMLENNWMGKEYIGSELKRLEKN